ncbi:Nascent polypeptide-associated complex NAC domain [Sesbania bispinosa]|nr:Nascent polypeptide-associated complex NAC domain [Sesbania bispinosa]
MMKLGMEPVLGVHMVTIKKNGHPFIIQSPTVFKHPTSGNYVVFGAANIVNEKSTKNQPAVPIEPPIPTEPVTCLDVDEDEWVDESEMNPLDIEFLMSKCEFPRAKAVKALKDADNDMIIAYFKHMGFN